MNVRVFAPASCGNVCVGFDKLGLCYENVGDTVIVEKSDTPGIIIEEITGVPGNFPKDPKKNTAGIVLLKLIEQENLNFGFKVKIEKGIYSSSGMGGSAASAIGALVAANEFLKIKLPKIDLLKISLEGEKLSSGTAHVDNVAPCLFGGLTFINQSPLEVITIPFPQDISILLSHPHLEVSTKKAREVLPKTLPLEKVIKQSENLTNFILSCQQNDLERMKLYFKDELAEPYRGKLTTGYFELKELILKNGAIGHSISGSGPSQITLCSSKEQATNLKQIVNDFYKKQGIPCDFYIGKVNKDGAKVL